jgi:hypothetical protein
MIVDQGRSHAIDPHGKTVSSSQYAVLILLIAINSKRRGNEAENRRF